jgi:hypothetical protein
VVVGMVVVWLFVKLMDDVNVEVVRCEPTSRLSRAVEGRE